MFKESILTAFQLLAALIWDLSVYAQTWPKGAGSPPQVLPGKLELTPTFPVAASADQPEPLRRLLLGGSWGGLDATTAEGEKRD